MPLIQPLNHVQTCDDDVGRRRWRSKMLWLWREKKNQKFFLYLTIASYSLEKSKNSKLMQKDDYWIKKCNQVKRGWKWW